VELALINEIEPLETCAYLFEYDSVYGTWPGDVRTETDALIVDGQRVPFHSVPDLRQLDLSGVDLVLECTGMGGKRAMAERGLAAGARTVLVSGPSAEADITLVMGANEEALGDHRIISNASCTTNCVVPVIQCLDEAFGLEYGVITTIHSAMNDQPVIDAYHHQDLRKTRSAVQSIIPVDTEIAKGIGRILPALDGRFSAQAMRVPTLNVSAIDLTVTVRNAADIDSVNKVIRAAAARSMPQVLACTDEPLASCDFNHDPRSAIVDLSQTRVSGPHLIKVLAWFDNEWAYANRMLDVANLIRQL
jgi:glyceraldehyde-3-phosphate dehydrogenase type I